MKLRTKSILFFGTFLLVIALGIIFHTEYVMGDVFKKQTVSNLRIIAEQSESAYLAFLGSMKVRVIDWTSDSTLRDAAKAVMNAPKGSIERERFAKEFGEYVSEKKMPFDETIIITDLLDKDGIVIASTRPERIGKNEKEEEREHGHGKVHNIEATMNSKFGEAFSGTIVIDEEESPDPLLNVTVRLFEPGKGGMREPLDMMLLVYYSNVAHISEVLTSRNGNLPEMSSFSERQTARALLDEYKTSDMYLVNNDRIIVTPSRTVENVRVKQRSDTLPVRECLENGNEITEEYDNYMGVRVLGASMCFQKEGVVILAEIQSDEIFAPMKMLIRSTMIGGAIFLVFGIFVIILFVRRPLARINDIVLVAKQVAEGNLGVRVEVGAEDEVGYLGLVFNRMIATVRNNQKYLQIAKNRVEEEEIKDEAVLESLGEGMITTDKAGNITLINRTAEKILGWKKEEIVGKNFVEAIPAVDEGGKTIPNDRRAMTVAIATGVVTTSGDIKLTRKDGILVPVVATVTPVILDKKTIGAVSIFRDATKEKELEQTRRDLLSLASHQLRTPLSGTKWLIETLKRGLHGPLTPGQTEYLDEIYKINEKMTTLVHDMLGVLRMEGDETLAKRERISVKETLDTVFETLEGAAKSKNVTLLFTDGAAEDMMDTDPLILQNILESIISNAINYSRDGNEVIVSIEKNPAEIIFIIKDSGIGIPKDEQARLFERFYRASNAKTFDTGGTGLGLYIASMLAKKIGAHILFESEENKGSTFFVHVPYWGDN